MFLFQKSELKSSLAITTNVGCRNVCNYCPQPVFIKSYRRFSDQMLMKSDDFKNYIRSVPENICISFSGFSEPWLNPECTHMIIHAHGKGHKIRVNTTLIGIRMEDINQLKEVPFIKFVVHLPDNSNLTKIKVDKQYLDVLNFLLQSNLMNLFLKFHVLSPEIKIHPEVEKIIRRYHPKIIYTGVNNRAGSVKTDTPYKNINCNKVLSECQDFHHNILLPNGDVVLCHMDWELKHVIGNLLYTTYENIYNSEEFQKVLAGLKNINSDILCRQCEKDIVYRNFFSRLVKYFSYKIKGVKEIY